MLTNPLSFHVVWPNGHLCYTLPEDLAPVELQMELIDAQRVRCQVVVETETEEALEVVAIDNDGSPWVRVQETLLRLPANQRHH